MSCFTQSDRISELEQRLLEAQKDCVVQRRKAHNAESKVFNVESKVFNAESKVFNAESLVEMKELEIKELIAEVTKLKRA